MARCWVAPKVRGTAITDSAGDRAYAAIREGILNGTHQPEEMLSEALLATQIGVSRTPVRAALVRLQDEGWITIYPKRGALVRGMSESAIADLADARLILEASAVQRATPAARETLAERLKEDVEEQKKALGSGDLNRFIELTVAFHRAFVEASGNLILLELSDRISDRQRFLLRSQGESLLARCAAIIEEHAALVEHLSEGDASAFADELRKHLSDTLGPDLRALWPREAKSTA